MAEQTVLITMIVDRDEPDSTVGVTGGWYACEIKADIEGSGIELNLKERRAIENAIASALDRYALENLTEDCRTQVEAEKRRRVYYEGRRY